MTKIAFYHLRQGTVEEAIPKLLELTLKSEKKALVRVGSADQLSSLSSLLWSQDKEAWLPHGFGEDGYSHEQPIWLTADEDNPNGASYVFLLDGVEVENLDQFERCFDLFNGNDQGSVAKARVRWRLRKQAGYKLNYWQQNESGKWMEISDS